MKHPNGRKPLIPEKEFIESWNRNAGDYHKIALELNMKPNTVFKRGSRLHKEFGYKGQIAYKTFDLNYERLESETRSK